ncbi:conjugative transposon protein TraJ [Sphingobacterium corticis]|uniref:Conjugative transposon protein TraJ n=1 Tax=Sphingobacterium corticis TaxID=1812823 RepID=A0ABW5NIW4_9SPHI
MRKIILVPTLFLFGLIPQALCQGLAGEMNSLHAVLDQLYQEMLPLCSQLIGVGQGIAGFGALWYISSRVWKQLVNAEAIDFYPLFRPFVLGFCIIIFPSIIGLINGVLQPTVDATGKMVSDSGKAIRVLLERKEQAVAQSEAWEMYVGDTGDGDRQRWYKYTQDEEGESSSEGFFEGIGNDIRFAMAKASYSFRNSIKLWMSEVLAVLYEAAALCINTLRTFQLIVLAILGPLVFGLAVFDGFQHTLTVWLARYINVFLWLPVANIFGSIMGKIQENMLRLDLSQIEEAGDTFFSRTDMAYIVFMIIGIAGYFTVPSVANYIVHAGGGSAATTKVTNLFSGAVTNATAAASGMARDAMGDASSKMSSGMASSAKTEGYFPNQASSSSYMNDKIKGNQ